MDNPAQKAYLVCFNIPVGGAVEKKILAALENGDKIAQEYRTKISNCVFDKGTLQFTSPSDDARILFLFLKEALEREDFRIFEYIADNIASLGSTAILNYINGPSAISEQPAPAPSGKLVAFGSAGKGMQARKTPARPTDETQGPTDRNLFRLPTPVRT